MQYAGWTNSKVEQLRRWAKRVVFEESQIAVRAALGKRKKKTTNANRWGAATSMVELLPPVLASPWYDSTLSAIRKIRKRTHFYATTAGYCPYWRQLGVHGRGRLPPQWHRSLPYHAKRKLSGKWNLTTGKTLRIHRKQRSVPHRKIIN